MRAVAQALIAHGGGPTPVLNASLAGAITEARKQHFIQGFLGARFGIGGVLQQSFYDLFGQSPDTVSAIGHASGSAIGSSRLALQGDDYERAIDIFRRLEVRYFFLTGGNGSMDTAHRIFETARHMNYELFVIGVPKTIDNDLAKTDHTPGYASAARFFAHAARDIGEDNRSLPTPIVVLETLGRNVGWIVAGTALARVHPDDAPHLIYFPEAPVSLDRIAADVEAVYRRLGRVLIAVCEGQKDEAGGWFGSDLVTSRGARDQLPANLGHTLARALWSKLGLRARSEKPGLFGRSCVALSSSVDRQESFRCGEFAVRAAVSGHTDQMVCLQRVSEEPYLSELGLVPLGSVSKIERPFPANWRSRDGNDVNDTFFPYVRPLVGEVAAYPRFTED